MPLPHFQMGAGGRGLKITTMLDIVFPGGASKRGAGAEPGVAIAADKDGLGIQRQCFSSVGSYQDKTHLQKSVKNSSTLMSIRRTATAMRRRDGRGLAGPASTAHDSRSQRRSSGTRGDLFKLSRNEIRQQLSTDFVDISGFVASSRGVSDVPGLRNDISVCSNRLLSRAGVFTLIGLFSSRECRSSRYSTARFLLPQIPGSASAATPWFVPFSVIPDHAFQVRHEERHSPKLLNL